MFKKVPQALRVLDYAVAALTLLYGLYQKSPLIAGLGAVGLVLAHVNLAERMTGFIQRKLSRKKAQPATLPDFTLESLAPAEAVEAAPDYRNPGLNIRPGLSHSSKHSLLRTEQHLNHAK